MSVDINTKEPNVFASASLDRRACIWDDRIANPAACKYIIFFFIGATKYLLKVFESYSQNYIF